MRFKVNIMNQKRLFLIAIGFISIVFFSCQKSSSSSSAAISTFYDSLHIAIANGSNSLDTVVIGLSNSPFAYQNGDSLVLFNADSTVSAFSAASYYALDSIFNTPTYHNFVLINLTSTNKASINSGTTYTLPANSFYLKLASQGFLKTETIFTNDSTHANKITINTLNGSYVSGKYTDTLYSIPAGDTAYVTGKFQHIL